MGTGTERKAPTARSEPLDTPASRYFDLAPIERAWLAEAPKRWAPALESGLGAARTRFSRLYDYYKTQ